MLPAPATALRISALLCLLLVTASSVHVASFLAGDTVTLSCSDETNTTRNLSDIALIIWRKENGSHFLRFVSDRKKYTTNFTDPRISFLSAQIPPVLQIRDAQTKDEGNYTCEVTVSGTGKYKKSWTLQISESASSALILISSSVSGAFLILVVIAGIIYCKFCSKRNTIPSRIQETSPENNEKEEPVYDNAHEDYFLRFNTLYDRRHPQVEARRMDIP